MRLAALLLVLAAPAHGAETEAFVMFGHDSHIARGCPRRCDESERNVNALEGGVTITAGKRRAWEFDLAHGVITVDGRRDTASHFAARFYPGRLRK